MRLHGLDGAAWPDELNGAIAQCGGVSRYSTINFGTIVG